MDTKVRVIVARLELWITRLIVFLKADRIKKVEILKKEGGTKRLVVSFELRNKRLESLFNGKFVPFSGYSSIVKQVRNLYYGPEMIENFFADYARKYIMWTKHDENDYLKTMKFSKHRRYIITVELVDVVGAKFFLKFEILSLNGKVRYYSTTQQAMTAVVLPGLKQRLVNPKKIRTLRAFLL